MKKARKRRLSPEAKRTRLAHMCQKFLFQLTDEEFKKLISNIEISRAMRAVYGKALSEQFNRQSVLFNRFAKGDRINISSRSMSIPNGQ